MLQGRLLSFAGVPSPNGEPGTAVGRVVQVGKDPDLLRLRGKLLDHAGHRVHSFAPEQAFAELESANDSQLWIFCHTLPLYELAGTALAIRRSQPGNKLLLLAGLHGVGQAATLFHGILKPEAGIDELLMVVANLASTPSAKQGR